MRTQLTAALKLCSTAENALILGRAQLGRDAIKNTKRAALWIRTHLDEPNHVPAGSVREVRDRLAELEKQISSVEAQFQP